MKKPIFITTSIAYINAEPHIGFLYELLAADVLSRYYKLRGDDVFFLTGTDEHGVKVAEAARAAGQEPQVWADETSAKFKDLGEQFNIEFDYFVRTTDPAHKAFVQKKWRQLNKTGVLVKKSYSALYCRGCEAFKQAIEIKDGKCAIHETTLEKVEEENYFFKISDYKSQILNWVNAAVFPESRRQEVVNVLESGAYDEVSVSRPKEKYRWGVEVPGDSKQIMYVWVDALFNYLSGIELSGCKIDEVWPADIQIIGKDILKFHAVIWPALLLATGYELPKKLLVHGFINVDGKKLSKSSGHIVYPKELLERYGAEASRYLLFRQLNFYEDSNFSWEDFDAIYNGELANGVGNTLQRLKKLLEDKPYINGIVNSRIEKEKALYVEISRNGGFLDLPNFKLELDKFNHLISRADKKISDSQAWKKPDAAWRKDVESFKKWEKGLRQIEIMDQVGALNDLIRASYIIEPFMPNTAEEIRRQLKALDSKPLFPRL